MTTPSPLPDRAVAFIEDRIKHSLELEREQEVIE